MSNLIKSKNRSDALGEVFTPQWLVDEMLDELPQEVFTNPEKTFIDPACGDGNFLVRVLERKIQNGSTPLQALQTTYGIDIMPDNIEQCRQRLFGTATSLNGGKWEKSWREPLIGNIRLGNTLERPIEDIFTEDTQIAEERLKLQKEILSIKEEMAPLKSKLQTLQEKMDGLLDIIEKLAEDKSET
jgi:hypothetical protein